MPLAQHTNDTDEITVLGGRVKLCHIPGSLKASIDSVLLAASCPAKPGSKILDLGCGVGTAGLCVLNRVENTELTGIDIQDDHIEMAEHNAALNALSERSTFSTQSIMDYVRYLEGSATKPYFDHVICNPPYLDAGAHLTSLHAKKQTAIGQSEEGAALQDWLDCALRNLKNGGSFTIIHRADHTDKIIQGLGKRFGAIEIIPFWPKSGQPAKRVIIRALKNRQSPAHLHPGLTLHEEDGSYTKETEEILRNAAPLL